MKALLDSNVIILHLRGNSDATRLLQAIRDKKIVGVINQTICFETYTGIPFRHDQEKAMQEILELETVLENKSLSTQDFKKAGILFGTLGKKGTWIDPNDAVIAQHALETEIDFIVTENTKHFKPIKGLGKKTRTIKEMLEEVGK